MEKRHLAPPVGLLAIFLDTHAKAKDMARVREFALKLTDHSEAHSLGVRSYNSLISAFARINDVDAAMRYFERMVSYQVRPNQISFCSLISAYSRAGRVHEGFRLYEAMVTRFKQQPDLQTYTVLIKLCWGRPELMPRAFEFFAELRAQGLTPTHAVYHAILEVRERRRHQHAHMLFCIFRFPLSTYSHFLPYDFLGVFEAARI